jgi:uncharacterized protein YndB with AHSA1/START domain
MTQRSVTHATFTLERTYDATPKRVFNAFADPAVKALWFAGPDDWENEAPEFDFRVGGRETNVGRPKGGPLSSFEARYYDIVPDERIIFAYDMLSDDKRISVSLTTIELQPAGNGTRLTFTEQGAFLEGYDDPSQRERGTRELLDALGAALAREPAGARRS